MERRPTWQIAADIANAFDPETGEVDLIRVEALEADLADKAEAIHTVIAEHDAQAEACRAESKRLLERAGTLARRSAKLREYLLACMVQAGTRKLETPLVTASIRAGSERVDVLDLDALPLEYLREKVTVEADKTALKAMLKTGATIPGAALVRGEESLQFR